VGKEGKKERRETVVTVRRKGKLALSLAAGAKRAKGTTTLVFIPFTAMNRNCYAPALNGFNAHCQALGNPTLSLL
jgi:hypothetical protein